MKKVLPALLLLLLLLLYRSYVIPFESRDGGIPTQPLLGTQEILPTFP